MKIGLDAWTLIDLFISAFNITLYNFINHCQWERFTNADDRLAIDISVIVIMVLAWIRFFSYFLVLKPIAKLVFTLYRMALHILTFMFIFMCYIVMASIIFTMVFGNVAPEEHGTLQVSMKTLFFAFNGHYSYIDV